MTQLIAYVYHDPLSKVYCGEIKDSAGKVINANFSYRFADLMQWAREHNARVIDLDSTDRLNEALE